MATLPDVKLLGIAYQNLYTATGITVGTSVTIQNKSVTTVYLQNIATQPDGSSRNGLLLQPYETVPVTGTIVGLWAFGAGNITMEIIT